MLSKILIWQILIGGTDLKFDKFKCIFRDSL